MADRNIIAVVGATGAQGGGLVRAILDDPAGGYGARAITRSPDGDKGRALAAAGAEVVGATIDDEDSLVRAFTGADAAFLVTFFWDHMSPEKETIEIGNLARAAKKAGVRHVVWSTLEDTRRWVPLSDDRMPTLMGNYKVPHLDAKGAGDDIFRGLGVPATFLLTSFYWENFIHFGMGPQKTPDGKWAITLPMGEAKLPGIAVDDIGRCAYGIIKQGGDLIGRTIGVAGEHLTGKQMASELGRAMKLDVQYNDVPPAVFRGFGFPGADDLGNMFQFKRDFNAEFCGARDIAAARALNPRLQTFREWLQVNAARIPVQEAAGGA